MARVTRDETAALGASTLAALAAAAVLHRAIEKSDPGAAALRAIRADADPSRDLLVLPDAQPDALERLAPLAAVAGRPDLRDLGGFRRLYVLAEQPASLVPYLARLGPSQASLGPKLTRWDLAGIATVRFDLATELLTRVSAHRDGGPHAGPCVPAGARLQCHSPDDWNHLAVLEKSIGGSAVRCVFAHPQAASRLVFEVRDLPPAAAVVGGVGLEDGAAFPGGAAVTNHVRFEPSAGGPAIERDVVAPNANGLTAYRLDLGRRGGALSFTITTPNAGARRYCFTAYATD